MTQNFILMGYSGSGKDTSATILARNLPESQIVKFSQGMKDRLAKYAAIDPLNLEDREFRATTEVPGIPGKTYLDFMVDSYHVYQVLDPTYWARYTVDQLDFSRSLIFTDIRSLEEMRLLRTQLQPTNTTVVWLDRPGVEPKTSDHVQRQIYFLWLYHDYKPGWIWNNGDLSHLEAQLLQLF